MKWWGDTTCLGKFETTDVELATVISMWNIYGNFEHLSEFFNQGSASTTGQQSPVFISYVMWYPRYCMAMA